MDYTKHREEGSGVLRKGSIVLWVLAFLGCCLVGCKREKPAFDKASNSQRNSPGEVDKTLSPSSDSTMKRDGSSDEPDRGHGVSAKKAMPESKRVVMIIVDTLRADRLGCYGYTTQPTTPNIDKLAKEGVLFEHFAVASPWTAPSFGTILTGLPPTMHGAGKILPKSSSTGRKVLGVRVSGLGKSVPVLPEMISDVKTAAIMNNAFLHPALGFARGFDHYDHKNASLFKSRLASEVTDAASAWLTEHKDDNFFLLVHYFDPHISYDPPEKYRKLFAPGQVGRMRAPFSDHFAARRGKLDPSEKEKAFIIGLYNGELRFVDDQIGVLMDRMKGLGMLDDTWIVVTSDHGEEQFDHGSFDHGHRYEEEVTRVPFIMRAPSGKWNAGKRIPYLARHVDIVPTALELFQVDAPKHLVGRSLMSLIDNSESAHRLAYMEYNLYWGQKYALYDGRYKFIGNVYAKRGYLYDLEEDPGEQRRLGADHPKYGELEKQSEALRENFRERAKKNVTGDEAVELPPDVEKSLRSLGYIQ